jgi:hypothetical protein
MKPQGHVPASARIGAHEGADLDVPLIARLAALLGSILVLLVLATMVIFYLYEKQYPHRTSEAAPVVTSAELPPAPRLQVAPRADLQEVRASEDAHLEGYAWVDRAKSVARIPIERAMARWVELQNAAGAGSSATNAPGGAMPLNPALVAPAGNAAATSQPAKTEPAASMGSRAPASSGVTELQMRQDKAKGGAHAH